MYYNVPIWGFILGTIFFSIIFTWIYNNTGRSILAVLLLHTTGNLSHFIFPVGATTWGGLYSVVLNAVVVAIILIYGDQKEWFMSSMLKRLRLTVDKRLRYASPKLPLATSFIRKPLYTIGFGTPETKRY